MITRETDVTALEAPNLSRLAAMAEDVYNGRGDEINTGKIIALYEKALRTVVDFVQGRTPSLPKGFRFFVPDLWHVAKGRARMFDDVDGDCLWDACVQGTLLGRQLGWKEESAVWQGNDGLIYDYEELQRCGAVGYMGKVFLP